LTGTAATAKESTMTDLGDLLEMDPYGLDAARKSDILTSALSDLTSFHYQQCLPYRRILDAIDYNPSAVRTVEDIPFLPVRLFKELDLVSVPESEIVKTMTSSGTTGQAVSRIFLDRTTASNQTRVLARLVAGVVGSQRLPMVIIDSPSVVKDRTLFSARGAGILGFSMFARDKVYALDDRMRLDIDALESFLSEHHGERILVFGFTFMIWQHFYKALRDADRTVDLSNGVLIHGGGWKKLAGEAVTTWDFRDGVHQVSGIQSAHDYYGMVEQAGSIYLECEQGHLHASVFSDVIVRRPDDFQPLGAGETGLIQVVSVLPASYPGHALLTEDEGLLHGEDDCPCGRLGRYFTVLGRVRDAELRGCSDTYGASLGKQVPA
jgi:phenylacetate-coenzyme A ligase PaaK-like adenylate-forming protein